MKIKKKTKAILISAGIIGIVLAAGEIIQPTIPSIVAEGQTISFPYTDENSNENLIIRTDQAVYNPLWAWNGFDVYVAVENKSGISQPVSFQSFFSKDFSVEEVYALNPNATTTIKKPVFADICKEITATSSNSTTTSCYQKYIGDSFEVVSGVWNPIVQQQFLREEYDKAISLNQIPVKQKIGDRITGNFIDYSLKDQLSYYKLRIKSNEPFIQEEFSIEAIGQDGSYGLCDPTVLTENFNSCNNGNLVSNAGCPNWTGDTGPKVQAGSADNPEGYQAGKEITLTGAVQDVQAYKDGTSLADGRATFYWKKHLTNSSYLAVNFKNATGTDRFFIYIQADGNIALYTATSGVLNFSTYSADTWYHTIVEWRSSDDKCRASMDDVTWTNWYAMDSTGNISRFNINFDLDSSSEQQWFDYIAENPIAGGGTAEPQMNVIIIE